MGQELLFATHNTNKALEIQNILGDRFSIRTLSDLGFHEEIPETENTLEGNALLKSRFLHDKLHCNVFSDDTGLEVTALNNEPGVFSARYAGEQKDNQANMDLLLENLKMHKDRSARFRTVISLFWDNRSYFFEGIVNGVIIDQKRGNGGFGYDPIFKPNGYDQTFAEMSAEQKNTISHRGRAIQKMIDFLNSQ